MQLSIIIPVYKEKKGILNTLARIMSLSIPLSFEILVVDGEPGAGTLSYIASQRDLPSVVRPVASPRGRGTQMNAGAASARGDLLFFLHVDTCPDQAGMDKLARAWQAADPSRFCGAFDLAIDSPEPWFRVIEKIASARSRLTRIPYGDQGIFISKRLFLRVGGFPDVPLMEDVGLMAGIKRTVIRPVFLDHPIRTSARRWQTQGVVYTTLRNWVLICLYLIGVPPEKLAKWY